MSLCGLEYRVKLLLSSHPSRFIFTKKEKEFPGIEKKCTFAPVKNPPLDVQGKWVWLNQINFNNAC